MSLPTGSITVWKWHTAPSPHSCQKRPCVSMGKQRFAHKQNANFFAEPRFESCTCTATFILGSIPLREFNSICCMLALYGHCSYSNHLTAMNEVVHTIHTVSNYPAHHRQNFAFSCCLHVILTSSEASQTPNELLSKWPVLWNFVTWSSPDTHWLRRHGKFTNNRRIKSCRFLQHSFVKSPLSSGEGQRYCLNDACGREISFTAAGNRTQETTVCSLVAVPTVLSKLGSITNKWINTDWFCRFSIYAVNNVCIFRFHTTLASSVSWWNHTNGCPITQGKLSSDTRASNHMKCLLMCLPSLTI